MNKGYPGSDVSPHQLDGDGVLARRSMRWVLEKGGEARVVETDGDRITLESTRAFPPGAPLVARAFEPSAAPAAGARGEAKAAPSAETYRVKVRGSRRVSPELFRVEGRLVNLSREQRERLVLDFKTTASQG